MLNLKLPIQYYSAHYVFMLAVCHHLYFLRALTPPPLTKELSYLFPIPQACPDILKSSVFLKKKKKTGPRMKTMLLFCNYLAFFVIFCCCCFVGVLVQALQNILISLKKNVKQICFCVFHCTEST